MRIPVIIAVLATLVVAGCGEDEARQDRDDESPRKSTTVVEYPEIDGNWSFVEGYRIVVQFRGRESWSEPRFLKPGHTASSRDYYGSSVRLTICDATCAESSDVVQRPESIRCQTRSLQRRGSAQTLRLEPSLVRDGDGDIGCVWTGSGIREDQCSPSKEFDGAVNRRRLVSPASLSGVPQFTLVERHGCATSFGGVRFTKMGWDGSFDCNSAAGRWRLGPGRRVRLGTNTSTLIACGDRTLEIAPENIAYVERLPSGDMRLVDEDWFPLAVGSPQRDVPAAYDATEGTRIAVSGTVIARGDDVRICSAVFTSLPPGCGDVGGRSGFVGSTMRVVGFDLDEYETEHAGDVQWIDEITLVGRRSGDTFTVEP